jgi:hypothetical protein
MVYFARKGNQVVHHTDLNAMREWEGVQPETQLTDAEFLAYDNLARLIDGQIYFGKTGKEKADEEAQARIEAIDASLQAIDAKIGGRPLRAAILALKGDLPSSVGVDIERIETMEGAAGELRAERAALVESLEIPY